MSSFLALSPPGQVSPRAVLSERLSHVHSFTSICDIIMAYSVHLRELSFSPESQLITARGA